MRVIFLDIDGVLNSEALLRRLDEQHRELGHHAACACFKLSKILDRDATARLNHLVGVTGAKIVISSSWRKLLDPIELHEILHEHGLVADIVGQTPGGLNDSECRAVYEGASRTLRGHEIDRWLRQHPEVDRFVILDDGSDMAMHKARLVQTDAEEGLLDEHVEVAIGMLLGEGSIERQEEPYGSSTGIFCRGAGCVETLTLSRTTRDVPSHEDDYQCLMPVMDQAAVSLGWRLYESVWWCPSCTMAKLLACLGCGSPCPVCVCPGGPGGLAVAGKILDAGCKESA